MAQLNNSSIDSVLAWGSVAYALGFVTVMVHTHDYGFPTLQLLDPIYIWIGWPLAAVAFFFYSTSSYFKRVSMEIYREGRDSIEYLRGSALNETDYLSRLNELEKSLYKMRVIYFINPPRSSSLSSSLPSQSSGLNSTSSLCKELLNANQIKVSLCLGSYIGSHI
jgi:hypothetical protein